MHFAYNIQVPLGVLPHNETSTDGMVSILELMNQYVPEVAKRMDVQFHHWLWGGGGYANSC